MVLVLYNNISGVKVDVLLRSGISNIMFLGYKIIFLSFTHK